jgi:TRAP-type C4-dicarboxylate transport system substrate-binding protein
MATRRAGRWAWPIAEVLCLQAGSAAQAQAITLRLADSFPAGRHIWMNVTRWFRDQVTERTARRVKFHYDPTEQFGNVKDTLSLTRTGVGYVAHVASFFITDQLPLCGAAELPFGLTTSCECARARYKLTADGIAADRELKPNSIRLLFMIVLPPNRILVRGPGLKTIESVRSPKVRSGKAKEPAVQALGAVPIEIATPDPITDRRAAPSTACCSIIQACTCVAEIEFAGDDMARIAQEMSEIGKARAKDCGKPGSQIHGFEEALH